MSPKGLWPDEPMDVGPPRDEPPRWASERARRADTSLVGRLIVVLGGALVIGCVFGWAWSTLRG